MKARGRVVFDTGALVSAALRESSPEDRALSLVLRYGVVCLCEQSIAKLRTALARSKFDSYMRKRARMAFVAMLLRNAWICPASAMEPKRLRLRRHNRGSSLILALAAAAEADAIVSSKTDLLTRKAWRGIPILTSAEFVDRFA